MVSSSFKMSLRIENWTDFCCDFRWFGILCFMRGLPVFLFFFFVHFNLHSAVMSNDKLFFLLVFFVFPLSIDKRQEELNTHTKKNEAEKKQQIRIHVKYSLKAIENWATVYQQWNAMERNECQTERETERANFQSFEINNDVGLNDYGLLF